MIPFYLEILLALCLIFFLYAKRPEVYDSTLGIYRVKPGRFYYLKYYAALIVLKLRRLFGLSNRSPGILSTYQGCSRQEGYHIYSSSSDRQTLILENGNKLLLKIPKFADCLLVSEIANNPKEIGPIIVEHYPVNSNIYREKAILTYNGLMKSNERDSKHFLVNIKAEWNVILPYFNMYWELSDENFANSISKELWSKDYFENFKLFQHIDFWGGSGEMKGNVTIDGQRFDLFVNFTQLFSNGDLSLSHLVHRYVLHYITIPSGPRFCVGVASLTQQFSILPIGWVTSKCKNYPIKSCDFQIHKYGEGNSEPPKAYHFLINTDGGDMYNIIVRVRSNFRFYHRSEKFKKVIDSDCNFIVNGEEGWGHVQWYYRR
ncbi:uncharacterized protein LOC129618599 [Condylostylus longicornis]|uniref:uncharacterized protein LOC129618599 n=1 Tax=Condylostylus longicornis TaxID=2530218 RepID=UPI00244DB309|nr:uncharacterized protein LOC129618599 [Condylostylus longicornis]